MKILFFTPYVPYPLNNGGLIRVHHLLLNLGRKHNVTCICMEPDNDDQAAGIGVFNQQGINVKTVPVANNQKKELKRFYQLRSLFSSKPYQYQQYYSTAMQEALSEHLKEGNFDLLLVEFSQMGYYRFDTDIPKYVDQHNVEYEIMRRTFETEKSPLRKILAYSEWRKYSKQEIENCEKFTACLTTSKRDADILQQRSPNMPCHVIPNGVDSSHFQAGSTEIDANMVLFTGTISYYPNTEGILWFHKNVWPLITSKNPDATFCIAGKAPPPEVMALAESDPAVTVTGMVDDMRDYYNKAAVVVVPLRVGGGTRLKILEGMSMSKAIVSTTVGAEGINHEDGTNILLKDTPEDFSKAVLDVMADSVVRQKLEKSGRDLVEAQYDWHAVTDKLSDIFEAETGLTASTQAESIKAAPLQDNSTRAVG